MTWRDVATTGAFAKRASSLTKAIFATGGNSANGVEVATDGVLAIKGNLAEGKGLRRGGLRCHEGQLCRGRIFAVTTASNFARVMQHCPKGQLCHKGRLGQWTEEELVLKHEDDELVLTIWYYCFG
jgi:hypothetical protein